jgi:hypothetical protein
MTVGQNIGHVRADKPPSAHAMACLRSLPDTGSPAQEFNFTVRDKLVQFGYAKLEDRPSPYRTHKAGRTVPYLIPTDAGRKALQESR